MKYTVNTRYYLFFSSLLVWLVSGQYTASAQTSSVNGRLADQSANEFLFGVGVIIAPVNDTLNAKATLTDEQGAFRFQNLVSGTYLLKTSYLGYSVLKKTINLNGDLDLGTLMLKEESTQLKEVDIKANAIRIEQKGDTTEYNANSYKTNPDATAEDLIKKMPGLTVENGTVKVGGEEVKRVLLDGQEFFGEDATLALRNLPAEVIDKIQTFDRESDQARFSGFDDGNAQKTINIVTKSGKANGTFGKIFGGYGSDNRYSAGGNINQFKGSRRISLMGLTNNVNQQNFSSQDLLGVSSGGRQSRGGGPGGGGSSNNNFLVGQQGGINTTNSVGLNYGDKWGKKLTFTGSYFFNNSNNNNNTLRNRQYFLSDTTNQLYDEANTSESDNYNHRFNARLEYKIDSANTLIFTPKLSFQNNRMGSKVAGQSMLSDGILLNGSVNDNQTQSAGYTSGNSLLFQHKFRKPLRTFAANLKADFKEKNSDNTLVYQNIYYSDAGDSVRNTAQRSHTPTNGQTYGVDLTYTEPLSKGTALQFNYKPSYALNEADKQTSRLDSTTGSYEPYIPLSNRYDNTVSTQRGGLSYRLKNPKTSLSIGTDYQLVQLRGNQEYPYVFHTSRNFTNLLPNAMYQYKFDRNTNLRMTYRTATDIPSVTQLQSVINNTNPLLLSTGNPYLQQEYTHTLSGNYRKTMQEKGRNFMLMANVAYTSNYITNSTLIAGRDTVLTDDIVLHKGSQLTAPVNLEGYLNTRIFSNYGLPLTYKSFKTNLNLNLGLSYSRAPGQINNQINYARTYNFNSGFVLGSNMGPQLDFSVSWNGNYNIVDNSINPKQNNNYYYQISAAKANWLPWKGLVLATELTHTYYTGLGGNAFNQSFLLWNAALGYKFLKNNAGELRLSVFDLLGQNKSISRTVSNTYIEDVRTQMLTRYFMLTFSYTLRSFKDVSANAAPGAPEGR